MFLKQIIKKDKQGKREYIYYRLCESYRIDNKSRHRNLMSLGTLDELTTPSERKSLADRIEQLCSGQSDLFAYPIADKVEKLAQSFYKQLRSKLQVPIVKPEKKQVQQETAKHYVHVDLNSIEHDEGREVGAEWLCLQTLQELKLEEFLQSLGWDQDQINTSLLHIISKAVFPASELKTSQWISENTALSDIIFNQHLHISRHQLYKSSLRLYAAKDNIEQYLSTKTNELFDFQDKIILYDLTNTYFEGRKEGSTLAKFGRSKEKRSDAKLLALALVVNSEGFVKYSRIYSGNIADPTTLSATIESLSKSTSFTGRKPTVVIDAGIATEDNLKMLKEKGYHYLCVTRSKLKDYNISAGTSKIEVFDSRDQLIEIQKVNKEGETDQFLYVRSHMKAKKEVSMQEHYSSRYEEELKNISESIHKKGGTKKIEKVWERLGRIKERYPAANKHYNIDIKSDKVNAVSITWERIKIKAAPTDGVYFLRTSLGEIDENEIWEIYNTLTEVESTFRTLKTDLSLRPIHHQKDNNSEAHIFLGITAYMVVATIRYRLKSKKINHDWKNIVRKMNTQKMVSTTMNDNENNLIITKKCSKPCTDANEIYHAMGYKNAPFHLKKFVLPQK
jgi:hypothetical protein